MARGHRLLDSGLGRVETGLEIFPNILAVLGISVPPLPPASTPEHSEWQLRPVSTNLLGQGGRLVCSSQGPAWWAGPRSIMLLSQRIPFLACLHYKGEINPELSVLVAPSQVLKCHFWGAALPRAGCSLQGNMSPSSPSHRGSSGPSPPPLRRPCVPQHDP